VRLGVLGYASSLEPLSGLGSHVTIAATMYFHRTTFRRQPRRRSASCGRQ
jgi:hypothetical protein